MTRHAIALAACIFAAPAAALTVERPIPIPQPIGLLLHPDPLFGRHAYRPATGPDVLPGGKLDWPRWTPPPVARMHVTRPTPKRVADLPPRLSLPPVFPLPRIDTSCCTGGGTPHNPVSPPAVPLPATVWLLLAALGALGALGRWVKK